MERRTIEYLNPQEQLRVSALVNRLCEIETEEFDAEKDLEAAKEIVKALDKKLIDNKNKFKVAASVGYNSESRISSGATNLGNVSASFDERKRREISIGGFIEYRIGAYVAQKQTNRGNAIIRFEHFFGRGGANDALDIHPPYTVISYRNTDLDVEGIYRYFPRVKKFPGIQITTWKPVTIWKTPQFNIFKVKTKRK